VPILGESRLDGQALVELFVEPFEQGVDLGVAAQSIQANQLDQSVVVDPVTALDTPLGLRGMPSTG